MNEGEEDFESKAEAKQARKRVPRGARVQGGGLNGRLSSLGIHRTVTAARPGPGPALYDKVVPE